MANPLKEAFDKIDMQIRYYKEPTIGAVSDFDKGVHRGRFDGLHIAAGIMKTGILELLQQVRKSDVE